MNSSKKSRGHDKYRFFINKPGTESEDIRRVLEEAEKEGYDLVAVNNTNTNNPPFIYGTEAVVNALDNESCCVYNFATPFETICRKGWYIIDTKLTIGEFFEVVKKANENRTKIEVERYRVVMDK